MVSTVDGFGAPREESVLPPLNVHGRYRSTTLPDGSLGLTDLFDMISQEMRDRRRQVLMKRDSILGESHFLSTLALLEDAIFVLCRGSMPQAHPKPMRNSQHAASVEGMLPAQRGQRILKIPSQISTFLRLLDKEGTQIRTDDLVGGKQVALRSIIPGPD